MSSRTLEQRREQNREAQRLWRTRHPDDARAQQATKRRKRWLVVAREGPAAVARAEASRVGGLATLARYGRAHYAELGRIGGPRAWSGRGAA